MKSDARSQVAGLASQILSGDLHPIDGARMLHQLASREDLLDDKDILFFIGLDSETDHIPRGEVRELCSQEWLEKTDREARKHLALIDKHVVEACENLIRRFSD